MKSKKTSRVLIIDDDKSILMLLAYNLKKEGYKIKTLHDSREAVEVANKFSPDLIILDLMMPHINGIELCREFRKLPQFQNTYIFFLTAKSESYYQEAVFDTGGDDFIEKIMGIRTLTNKINGVLKKKLVIRKGLQEFKIGNLILKRKSREVLDGNRELTLSKPEFELIYFFAQNPNKDISNKFVLQNLWGTESYQSEVSIDTCLRKLIKKFGTDRFQVHDNYYRLVI
jgi:two-component system alkaline phosphatase synthesis response regulator PhoP